MAMSIRWSAGWAVAAVVAAGCGRGDESLPVERAVRLRSAAFSTLAIDSAGRFWLGEPGALTVTDSSGASRRVETGGVDAPRLLGWIDGTAVAVVGDTMVAIGPDSGAVARYGSVGRSTLLLHVASRRLFQADSSGAVLTLEPSTLAPVGGWAARGLPSTALAASPEGDRIYHALGSEDAAPRLLFRDMQTGRVLGTASFSAPVRALASAESGTLYGVVAEGGRGSVMAMRPRLGELEVLWRTPLGGLRTSGESELRVEVGRGRVAVVSTGDENGLRMLEAEAGAVIGSAAPGVLDGAFGPGGELFLLYPGEVRVVR